MAKANERGANGIGRWCAVLELGVCVLPAAGLALFLVPSLIVGSALGLVRGTSQVGYTLLQLWWGIGGLFGVAALAAVALMGIRSGQGGVRPMPWQVAGLVAMVAVGCSVFVALFPAMTIGAVPWPLAIVACVTVASAVHLFGIAARSLRQCVSA